MALAQHLYRTNPEYRNRSREYHRAYERAHPLTQEQKDRNNELRRRRHADPAWRAKNAEKAEARRARSIGVAARNHRRRKYGLSEPDYKRMLTAQRGCCALCGEMPDNKTFQRRIHVDHDHETGQVRGLLCFPCNVALGGYEKMKQRVGVDAVERYLSGMPSIEPKLGEAV